MADYEGSFKEGIEAARKAQNSRKEIEGIFREFKHQIESLGKGKLRIELLTNPMLAMTVTFPWHDDTKTQDLAIVANNPTLKQPTSRFLAQWRPSEVGYPCIIAWGEIERHCQDKDGLERTLAELVHDPVVAEKLLITMTEEPPTKSSS
jgi:hypothetical protein